MASPSSPLDVSSFEPTSGLQGLYHKRLFSDNRELEQELRLKFEETTESLGQVNETAATNSRSTINGRNSEYNKTGSTISTSSLLNTLNEVTAAPASLESDAAEVHGLKSLEETSPPKSEWPPNGHNMRIVSIDTESCVVPKDMTPLRGYKYAQDMSELEELILHGETHDPEPTYQYYFHEAGYVMEFMEDPATWTFVDANNDHICGTDCPLYGALGYSSVEPST
ncbi:hypothetical protein D6D11_10380 [Aureobasidium pullulans]|nr:hypothetical protein D6D11_10380 [Aureobasidium pullulans]